MKGDANPRFPQDIGHAKKFSPGRAVEDMAVEADFGIDLLFDDNGEILVKELLEGKVHLYFFKDIAHDGLSALHEPGERFCTIPGVIKQPRIGVAVATGVERKEFRHPAATNPPGHFQFDSIVKIC